MITKITKEQEARIPYYLKKYRDLVKGETNREEQARSIKELYKLAGEDEPVILHFTSPTLAIRADKLLQNNKEKLRSQLYSQLRSQLYSQLYSELDSDGNYFWLTFWWNSWIAFYQFAKEIGVKFDEEKLDVLTRFAENLHCIIPYKGICITSDKPTEVLWHNSGVLHCEEGMAVKYSDGTGLYLLNGIAFDEDLYWKVVKKELTFEDIQKIPDIDKKAIAMKYMPATDFLKSVKAELVCKKTKRGNELWKIPVGNVELFDQDEYYLHYFCSSSGREYLEAVEPNLAVENNFNADFLMAKRHNFTIEQYLDEHFVGV